MVGATIRSGEHLVGTSRGVFKVSRVLRKAEDRRWSESAINDLKGNPMEPVPGSGHSRITAFSRKKDSPEAPDVRYAPAPVREEPELRAVYIYKRDIEKYGPTEGCPGCRAAMNPASSFRAKHTTECKRRFEEELKKTEEGKRRVERAEERMDRAVAKKVEEMVEGEGKPVDQDMTGQEESGAENGARASGAAAEEEVKEPKSDGSEGEPMQDDTVQLEEAPRSSNDKRVPLDPRNPAQKRGRESNPPKASAKWQAFEVPSSKRDREDDKEEPAKWQAVEQTEDEKNKPTDAMEEIRKSKVGERTNRKDMKPADMKWRDIGSGTMARSFQDATSLKISTHGGPPECEVHRRIVYDLGTGKVLDDCIIDDASDEELYRSLGKETDIRVELVLKEHWPCSRRRDTMLSKYSHRHVSPKRRT